MQSLVKNEQLLAVDLGLQSGMAMYGANGQLRWYRSQRFANPGQLRRTACRLLSGTEAVSWLISEGDVSLAAVWERVAMRQGVRVQRVSAHAWRDCLLRCPTGTEGPEAQRLTQNLARGVISWSGGSAPASLQQDAAEAILIGLWGAMSLGWLSQAPSEVYEGAARLVQV